MEVPDPPEDRVTLDGLIDALRPVTELAERDIVPEKPLRLKRAIVEVPDEPACIVKLDGLEAMPKSGGGGGAVTVTLMLVECTIEPLVPVTVTV